LHHIKLTLICIKGHILSSPQRLS